MLREIYFIYVLLTFYIYKKAPSRLPWLIFVFERERKSTWCMSQKMSNYIYKIRYWFSVRVLFWFLPKPGQLKYNFFITLS